MSFPMEHELLYKTLNRTYLEESINHSQRYDWTGAKISETSERPTVRLIDLSRDSIHYDFLRREFKDSWRHDGCDGLCI